MNNEINSLSNILEFLPPQVIIPFLIINLILMIIALIDCVRAAQVNGPKFIWVLVIITINLFGPIAYFIFGRSKDR